MIAVSFLMMLNITIPHYTNLGTDYGYGWPFTCFFPQATYRARAFFWVEFGFDILANLPMVLIVGLIAENFARLRVPRKP